MKDNGSELCEALFVHEEQVLKIRDIITSPELILHMSDIFKVLGDPTRLKIVLALQEEELCVCDLTAITDLPQSSVSHHLQALRKHNLVTHRRQGKMTFYSLSDHHVHALLAVSKDHASEAK